MLTFFEWCDTSRIGIAVRDSFWLFPAIEAVHLLAFAVIGGAVLMVDLRLLGWGLRDQPVRSLAKDLQPWLVGALVVMLISGTMLFLSEPIKCYSSTAFWVKMASLVLALIFTFTIRRTVVAAETASQTWVLRGKVVALVSMALWAGVAWGGRWIGFS
jgi:hypothetical protein